MYQYLDGREVHAYQFSVTEHLRKLDPKSAQYEAATGVLPGVFFAYELSPLRVRLEEQRRSLGHFLTNVCAIIGACGGREGGADARVRAPKRALGWAPLTPHPHTLSLPHPAGGVFTVMGLVDSVLYKTLEGMDRGKRRKAAVLGSLMQ